MKNKIKFWYLISFMTLFIILFFSTSTLNASTSNEADGIIINQTSLNPTIEIGDKINYTLNINNPTANTINDIYIYDILPFNNDNRGTIVAGEIMLEKITINFSEAPNTFTNYQSSFVANYTTNTSLRNMNFLELTNFSNWSSFYQNIDNTNKTITIYHSAIISALKFKFNLYQNENIFIEIEANYTGPTTGGVIGYVQKKGDVYVNNFYQTSGNQQNYVLSKNVAVQVLSSISISGKWNDSENNYTTRPEEIEITVFRNQQEFQKIKLNENNSTNSMTWQKTINNIPLYDSSGIKYNYSIFLNTDNDVLKKYYYNISGKNYEQETLSVTLNLIGLLNVFDVPQYNLTIEKQLLNINNQILKHNDFAKIKLNENSQYNFAINLYELERFLSKDENSIIESYGNLTGNIYTLIINPQETISLSKLKPGKYQLEENLTNYFNFKDIEKTNASQGAYFSTENGKYYITILGTTTKNENISLKTKNIIKTNRLYNDNDSNLSSFKITVNPKQTFAIYSTTDNSLTFYSNRDIVKIGDTYNNKIVSNIYTGFDNNVYMDEYDVPWNPIRNNIKKISFFNEINPISTAYWFYRCCNCSSIDLNNLNTSKVITMKSMFSCCESIVSLDLSKFNTTNVTNMYDMFYRCEKLQSLDLTSFNTEHVTDMAYMFQRCPSLKSLNLTSFSTEKVTTMSRMFDRCSALTILDLSSFSTESLIDTISMFSSNSTLQTIYVSNKWDSSKITHSTSMFSGCTSLKGQNGTIYNSSILDKTYAKIDNGVSSPGYFTLK